MKLKELKALGFDSSYHILFTKRFHIGCSQCEALCINGVPCHEQGCPNTKYECEGCNNIIDYKGYCSDCVQ